MKIIFYIVIRILLDLLLAFLVMFLWNTTIVEISKNTIEPITFFNAFGLKILCEILFHKVDLDVKNDSSN